MGLTLDNSYTIKSCDSVTMGVMHKLIKEVLVGTLLKFLLVELFVYSICHFLTSTGNKACHYTFIS